jgi:para-nitrobenzyl esterase
MKCNLLSSSIKQALPLVLLSTLTTASLTGCFGGSGGSDSGGGGGAQETRVGVFTDSPVSGIRYQTDSQEGVTGADGSFRYQDGETVNFWLGELELGSAEAAERLSPLDLVEGADINDNRVTNRLVLLQSLDEDRNLNNGIQISEAIAAGISLYADSLTFDQDPASFATSPPVGFLLDELNAAEPAVFKESDPRPRTLRSAADARAHLERTLSERRVVMTKYGEVSGFSPDENAWAWYGIPYAKPPIGELRWKPPVEPEAWEGVREATDWADQSAQPSYLEPYGKGKMSEDSLYLNVVVPKGYDGEKLPVMVWLHGGGYAILTSNSLSYNHTALPSEGVIVVTVNHRLGAFGYMAHPQLTAESPNNSSGNYSQLDQIAALKWVRDNIEEFGGDPENVTLFGQSGGGLKVISLLNSPLAEGLFHQAIIMSGAPPPEDTVRPVYNTLEQEEQGGISLVNRLGLQNEDDVIAAMRDVSWIDLANAANPYGVDFFKPNVDGWYVETDIRENGFHNDVPLIVGTPRNDAEWVARGLEWYMPFLKDTQDSDVYAYIYDHVPENWANKGVGAYHGIELTSVFGFPETYYSHYVLGLTGIPDANAGNYADNAPGWGPIDESIAQDSMSLWAQFARTGNPSTQTIDWPAFTNESEAFLLMDYEMQAQGGLLTFLK